MSYTCVSCGLEFQEASVQREHMKSEWHRYNLKRRVAQLPSIDEITFNLKIASLTSNESPEENSNSKKQMTKKDLRKKQKESIEAQRKKLLAAREVLQSTKASNDNDSTIETSSETNSTETSDVKEIKEKEVNSENIEETDVLEEALMAEKIANRVEIPLTTCLFCPSKANATFETLEENLAHMSKKHGLYIPERKYLIDLDGLISYLGEKIGLGNVCLKCSYQGRTLEAVREHMNSKRHMTIPYESEDEKLEISEFYDFSSTYSTEESTELTEGDENDDDWEDVSGEDADLSEEEIPNDALYSIGTELVLPSGAVIGHRSMAKYYRQNLPPPRILSEGQGTVIAAESRHFASPGDKKQLAISKRAWSHQKKREDVNDRRAAKFVNNQPYYRDQLLQ